jgi:uncharacterized protein YceK
MKKGIQSRLLRGPVLAGFLLASGCSSINGRGDSRFYPGIYPGLQYRQADYVDGSEGEPPLTWGYDDPVYDKAKVERRLGALIDFPFSIGLDTILLPWDLPYWGLKGRSR